MKRNLTHITGMVVGFVLIFLAINDGGELVNFIDIPSIIITLLGSFAALLIVFPIDTIKNIPRTIKLLLLNTEIDKVELLKTFSEMSRKSRMDGLLALEDNIEFIDNEIFKIGLRMVVDGIDADSIKDTLYLKLETTQRRHSKGQEVFLKWGELAPAFGMLGTLIGLIIMLSGLEDPSTIGVGMATALLTTFYGSLFANLIFLPIASNLEIKTEEEMFIGNMIIEGILELQGGTNTRVLEEKLITYLSPEEQFKYRNYDLEVSDGVEQYE